MSPQPLALPPNEAETCGEEHGSLQNYNTIARNLADMFIQLQSTTAVWSINHDFVRAIFFKSNLVRVRVQSSEDDLLSVELAFCLLLLYLLCVATKRNMVRKNYSKVA
jgi:hypothetical protein